MRRNTTTIVSVSLSVIVIVLLSLGGYRLTTETRHLTSEVELIRDSLALLQRNIDSLNAQRPGLGEYMSTMQLHAAKLWFAAGAANWKLAHYELDELTETMEAAELIHAHKNDVDITAVLRSVRATQLPPVRDAIAAGNLSSFRNAYIETLEACNGCHRPAGYGFIHMITPGREPVSNQQWKTVDQ